MKTNAKTSNRITALLLTVILVVGSFTCLGSVSAGAATQANGIVKGSDTPGVEKSYTTTLSSGESTTIKIVSSVLSIKVDGDEYVFKIGNIAKTTDAAVVNEEDALLHILTLGGAYYVMDLYSGVQIMAYRNSMNGRYCSSRNSNAYSVLGRSLINNTYFYELLTSNSVVREKLMSRYEFDIISGGGDPSVDVVEPTQAPTTQTPTTEPTEAPTTQAPTTMKPTEAPTTQAPTTMKPTEAPTTQAPTTMKPTEAPTTQAPTTMKPTEVPTTQAPTTMKPTEAPTTQAPTTEPTEAPTITSPIPIFDFEYWWNKYEIKIITLDQFLEVLKGYKWSYVTDSSGYIYYFYDNLLRFYTIKVIQAPTVEPTEAPTTQVPTTMKPTEAPTTQVPTTMKPTEAPTITSPKPIFDFECWWEKYELKVITLNQFLVILKDCRWSYRTDSNGCVYYFYDELLRFYTLKVIQEPMGPPVTEPIEVPTQAPTTMEPTEAPTTQAPTMEPTEAPITQAPTMEPTEAPTTQAPTTMKPTEAPTTQAPTMKPTEAPTTQVPTTKATQATIKKTKNPKLSKHTMVVYVNGKTKKVTLKNASGNVKWSRSNKKVKINPYGKNNQYCKIKGLKKGRSVVTVKCKGYTCKVTIIVKKVHSRVITSGKRIKLFVGKNRLHGWLLFNAKKGTMNYNGYKIKNVRACGFIKGSWNVIFIKKNGKAYILPRKTTNIKHKKRIKLGEKAIALNRDTYGFVVYIKTTCGGLKKVSGK